MSRINLGDTIQECIIKMADGNPGAVTVMAQVMKEAPRVDPDAAFQGFGVLCDFDELGIYGPAIWVLYKDVCRMDIVKLLGIMRAYQLGLVRGETVQAASRGGMAGWDLDGLLVSVRAQVPRFAHE